MTQNLRCHPIFMSKATLQNNTLPLINTNNSDNKVCILKYITIDTSEEISIGYFSINDIILTAKPNDIKTDAKSVEAFANPTQEKCDINISLDHPKYNQSQK